MREMKDSGIEWIGEIPADWSMKRVKHKKKKKNEKAMQQNPTILSLARDGVKVRDISNNEGQIAESYYNYNPVEEGDLLLNPMDLYSGANCSISKVQGVISPAYINLKANAGVNPAFYDYYFKVQYWLMAFFSYGKGVSYDNRWTLSAETLMNYPVVALPYGEQCKRADYLDRKCSQIDAIIAQQQKVIEKLKAYKLSVITEAVTKGLNPDVPMKDSGVEWIGEIPENWEVRRIGSFAKVTSSKRIFEESYVDEGVPFYRSKEITDLSKGLNVQTEIFIPEEVFEQVNEASPAPKCGDILLTSIGTIGNIWISDGRKFYYKDGNITQIEANDGFDSVYLKYCFSSNVVLEQYRRLAMGSTLLALTIIKIKKIVVAFPPLDEQRKIVRCLKIKCGSIDNTVKYKQRLIDKLTTYKKSLIYEVVTGKKEV